MPRVGFEPTTPVFERAKTIHALSWVSIVRGCHAQLFVRGKLVRLPCSCPASKRGSRGRLLIDVRKKHRNATRSSQLKKHSTLKSLCRGTKNRSDLARHAPSSRAAVFALPSAATRYRLCEAKQRILPRAAAARNRCFHTSYRWSTYFAKLL
jgi:hypothetical protein